MNQKQVAALVAAITTAVLPFFSEQDKSAKVTGRKAQGEKTVPRQRAETDESDEYDFILPVNGSRVRLRDCMVASGECKLYFGDTKQFTRIPATDDNRAKIGTPVLRLIGVSAGDGIGVVNDNGKWRAYAVSRIIVSDERAEGTASKKTDTMFSADSLFDAVAPKSNKGRAEKLTTYCPKCGKDTPHVKGEVTMSKKGRQVFRVTCSKCQDTHAKGTAGQHAQWAKFRAEHIDSGPNVNKPEYVKGEVTAKQAAREAKRSQAAENERRRKLSPAARRALAQSDKLRGGAGRFDVPEF